MDRIGSLYVDNATGISYRLTGYFTHYADTRAAEAEARKEGREFTEADYNAVAKRPTYSRMSLEGGASMVEELPDTAQRIWQPAN